MTQHIHTGESDLSFGSSLATIVPVVPPSLHRASSCVFLLVLGAENLLTWASRVK
jgi:hypothetical protein